MTDVANLAQELAPRLSGRILILTGAGVSAESGIPTFRGPGGYWRNRSPMELATMAAFRDDPGVVWQWYGERRRGIAQAEPNAAHHAITTLARAARECLVVTQNVDNLHERAGTPHEVLVHVHGEIFVTKCTECDFRTREELPSVLPPSCDRCGSLLRPGVVWFGESLDGADVGRVEDFLARGPCDATLVVGTTATFGYIIDWATRGGVLIEINPDVTPLSANAHHALHGPAGEILPSLIWKQT